MTRLHASLRTFPRVAERMVDPKVGIVKVLEPLRVPEGAPPFFHFAAHPANLAACGWQRCARRLESAAKTPENAAAKALLEAIRFYSAGFYAASELPLGTAARSAFPCVDHSTLALYSEEQYRRAGFPYVAFHPGTPVRWTQATSLMDQSPCHVPAALVHVPYRAADDEAAIVGETSSGLGCGASLAEATIAALCDVVRDDALAVTWYARLSRPHLRVETLSDSNYALVASFEECLGSVTLLNLTGELGIPVVLAALRCSAAEAPALVIGAAADLDPERAVELSLEDLALTFRHALEIQSHLQPRRPDDREISGPADHLRIWTGHALRPEADFLFASRERSEFTAMPRLAAPTAEVALATLNERSAAAGLSVLRADLSTPDVSSLGLSVVRVLVPGLYPLLVGPPALHPGRLTMFAARSKTSPDGQLPHPFSIEGVA